MSRHFLGRAAHLGAAVAEGAAGVGCLRAQMRTGDAKEAGGASGEYLAHSTRALLVLCEVLNDGIQGTPEKTGGRK